jgi:hypothetical protein
MNYQKIYNDLVLKAKSKNRIKLKIDDPDFVYYENHHIVPKSLKGSDDEENKVLLTAREHLIAHKLLIKIYPSALQLIRALWIMSNILLKNKKIRKIGAREYERLRVEFRNDCSLRMSGENNPFFGKKFSKEASAKISEAGRNRIFTDEEKKRRSERQTGRKYTEESKKKMSDTQRRLLANPERKANHSKAMKSLSILKCPHCGFESRSHGNLKRWHLDNCKQNISITKM